MPVGLVRRARDHGLNVSRVCSNALERTVTSIENETGATSRQTVSPAAATVEGRAS